MKLIDHNFEDIRMRDKLVDVSIKISIRPTVSQFEEIEKLRKSGMFDSRAEVARFMIQDYMNRTKRDKETAKIDDIKGIF